MDNFKRLRSELIKTRRIRDRLDNATLAEQHRMIGSYSELNDILKQLDFDKNFDPAYQVPTFSRL